jgi:curli biogenesis system outer membrane secretion channel CsgG
MKWSSITQTTKTEKAKKILFSAFQETANFKVK